MDAKLSGLAQRLLLNFLRGSYSRKEAESCFILGSVQNFRTFCRKTDSVSGTTYYQDQLPMTKRIPIPKEISTELLYVSDKTCCVCRRPRLSIQIHHIDENSSNNEIANLAVLCLECHNETQIKGGFGRKLNSPLVTTYRDKWHSEVMRLRKSASENYLRLKSNNNSKFKNKNEYCINDVVSLYIISKIDLYIDDLKQYKNIHDVNSTVSMVEYNYYKSNLLIKFAKDVSQFCKEGSFDRSDIFILDGDKDYFDSIFALAYEWARFTNNNCGGTLVNVLDGSVANEILKAFVASMMEQLFPLEGNAEQIDKIIQQFKSI
jgi:Restriction endonuclease